jgi:hypothetical protein
MKRLIPAALPVTLDFDPLAEFPEDVERLVTVAANAGYGVTPRDVAELWRLHAGGVCASWFAVVGTDQDIVTALLKHAEVQADAGDTPPPPEGYRSWLDFAVENMDTRTEEQERLWADKPVSRQAMRDAVRAELVALRRKAGEL